MGDYADLEKVVNQYESEEEPINFQEFTEYWKGEVSKGTLVQYMRYLSGIDPHISEIEEVDSFEEWIEQGFFQGWVREKSRDKFGTSENRRNSRYRYQYHTYLALKKYLEATEPSLLQHLSSSDNFKKPKSRKNTVRYTSEQIQKLIDNAKNQKTTS